MLSRSNDSIPSENGKFVDDDDTYTIFINEQMPELQKIIAETANELDASSYDDQQKYLQNVFDLSGNRCWEYMKKAIAKAEVNPDADLKMLHAITEKQVKETVTLTATGMFLQIAFNSLAE